MLSVIVPAYRSASTIHLTIEELQRSLDALGIAYEIVLVPDGALDETARAVARDFPRVRVVTYEIHRGKGYAIRYGIRHCRGDYIAYIDADLELHPSGLGRLLDLVRDGADVALGSKRHPESTISYPWFRRVQSDLYQWLVRRLFDLGVTDTQTGLKVFRAELLRQIEPQLRSDGFAIDLELLVALREWGGRLAEGPVALDYRFETTIGVRDVLRVLFDTFRIYRQSRRRRQTVRSEPRQLVPHGGMEPGAARPILEDLTVIVPTLGRPVLRECLGSMLEATAWPARIVVVDQGGNPDVETWIAELRRAGLEIEHVRAPRRGVAAARNRGIAHVATPYFAINDEDQYVHPEWPRRMLARLHRHSEAIISGMVIPAAAGVPSSITTPEATIHRRPLLIRDPLFAGNMGTSLDVYSRIGEFDEREPLNGAEDNDWGHRGLRAGMQIVYAPEVAVTHLDWRSAEEVEATYRHYARAQGAFYGKHLRRGDAVIAVRVLRDTLRGPWLIARAAITRNETLAALGRAEVAGIVPGLIAGWRSEAVRVGPLEGDRHG